MSFDDKMWLMGGKNFNDNGDSGCTNRIVYSTDGNSWTHVITSGRWSPRKDHAAVVFGDKIWVMGGNSGWPDVYYDVWSSANGKDWKLENNKAPWDQLTMSIAVAVYQERIWMCTGEDLWRSPDGVTWDKLAKPGWPAMSQAHLCVVNGQLILLGGISNDLRTIYNAVWSMNNRGSWTKSPDPAPWAGVWNTASATFAGAVWLLGGIFNATSTSGQSNKKVWCYVP